MAAPTRSLALLVALAFSPALAQAQALDADALKAMTSGKTQKEFFADKPHHEVFFRPDGRAFLKYNIPFRPSLMELAWTIEHGMLCLPDLRASDLPCQALTKLPDGTLQKDYGGGHVVTVNIEEGDPDKIEDQVTHLPKDIDASTRYRLLDSSATAPLPAGDYLNGDQLTALLSGKTLRTWLTPLLRGATPDYQFHYYAADGKAFMMAGSSSAPTIARGTWHIQNNRLCTEGISASPCFGVRRIKDGRYQVEYPGRRNSWNMDTAGGDPYKVADTVNNSYPYNQAPPVVPNQPQAPPNITVR